MRLCMVLMLVVAIVPAVMAQSPYTQVEVVPSPQTTSTPQTAPVPQAVPAPQAAPAPQGKTPPPMMVMPQGGTTPQGMAAPQGMTAPPGTQGPPPNPVAQMYAIYARGAVPEQPHMDEALKPVSEALAKLPFTSYEKVTIEGEEIPWGKETQITVNAKYTVNVTPVGQDEEGTIQLLVRIEMLQDDGSYVDALKAKALAAQNGALLFRGMPLNNGELVVVLLVGMPPDPNQSKQNAQDQQEQNEGEEQQQEQQEQQQDSEGEKEGEGENENDSQMNQEQSQEAVGRESEGEKEGQENLEALLESLEDMDKQEQKEERNQRSRIDFKGDWW